MKITRQLGAIAAALICMGGVAKADLIDLGIRTVSSVIGNPTAEGNYIESDQGLSFDLTYLNKFDYGSGFDNGGALVSSFFTVSPNSGETANATISWDLTGTGFLLNYVFLKDGRDGDNFLYHLYGVTADQTTIGGGDVTINGRKGISHIAFYGSQGTTTTVPEGGATAALLGMALCGVGLGRRYFTA